MTINPDFNRDLRPLANDAFQWLPRAEAHLEADGIDRDTVLGAVKYPDHVVIDPSSKIIEGRYYAERRRRGDLTVVIAFPPGQAPIIWGVYRNLPMPERRLRGPGGTGATRFPTTMRELRKRIVEEGLVIRRGGRHDRVETKDGTFVLTLPSTPSDHRTIPNVIRDAARRGYDLTR